MDYVLWLPVSFKLPSVSTGPACPQGGVGVVADLPSCVFCVRGMGVPGMLDVPLDYTEYLYGRSSGKESPLLPGYDPSLVALPSLYIQSPTLLAPTCGWTGTTPSWSTCALLLPQTLLWSIFVLLPLGLAPHSVDCISLLPGLFLFCDKLKIVLSMCHIFND